MRSLARAILRSILLLSLGIGLAPATAQTAPPEQGTARPDAGAAAATTGSATSTAPASAPASASSTAPATPAAAAKAPATRAKPMDWETSQRAELEKFARSRGYRSSVREGNLMWCKTEAKVGSRFELPSCVPDEALMSMYRQARATDTSPSSGATAGQMLGAPPGSPPLSGH